MQELVAIARVVKPRGLKGEVVAEVLTDFPERFEGLEDVTALLEDGSRAGLKIEEHWIQKERMVLKFTGHDSIEAVERLRNAEICVDETEAVELESDQYFDWELTGCEVVTDEGLDIGTVASVMRTGGTEILEVKGSDRDFLV